MNVTERRGLVAAAIAVTLGLILVVVGILIDGGGDSIDVAGGSEQTTTQPPAAPLDPAPSTSPDAPQPPESSTPPGESVPPGNSVPPDDPSDPPTTLPPDLPLRPGEGVEVVASRSSNRADAVPAEVTAALLRELGYQVSPPADLEVDEDDAYSMLASDEADIWVAGRYPLDRAALAEKFEDATIGDFVKPVGNLAADGAIVGLALDRDTANEFGITSLEELLSNPEAVDRYDRDGNGVPEVIMCDSGPPCGAFLELLGEKNLLDRLDLIDALGTDPGEDVIERYRSGKPVLFVHHEPHWLASVLLTGGDIVWLSLDDRVAASPQIDPSECSSDPCRLGVEANDLRSVANICFVDEHPAAAALLEAVTFDALELAIFDAELRSGRDPFGVSAIWLEQNRDVVDDWLGAARLAAVEIEPQPCDGGGGGASPA